MSTQTTNYQLIKPELTDVANITELNKNWDKIDSELASRAHLVNGKVPESELPIVAPTGAASTIQKDNLTNNRALISNENGKVAVSDITAAELAHLSAVKSNIQAQIDALQKALDEIDINVSGAASTIIDSNLTTNRALISNGSGKIAVSPVTSTELGYMSGVTSKVQTQLNNKLSTSGGDMSGSITFKNTDAYHALHKYRVINEKTYGVNVGCGILGGEGVVAVEVRNGNATDSPLFGRLEVGRLGVSYQNEDGTRTYIHRSGAVPASVEQ